MMESLYWAMKDYLGGLCPEFVKIKNPSVLARFRKRHIHLLDSSTIQLVLQEGLDGEGAVATHACQRIKISLHPTENDPITYACFSCCACDTILSTNKARGA